MAPYDGRAIAYETHIVMLNSFQDDVEEMTESHMQFPCPMGEEPWRLLLDPVLIAMQRSGHGWVAGVAAAEHR